MSKITCDVCMDLLPLVQDHAASEDSCALVWEHLSQCSRCSEAYNGIKREPVVIDDQKVLSKIKKQLFMAAIAIVVLGALLGVALTNGAGLFYNVLIMPTIGAIGYFALGKKSYMVPGVLFVFSYIWLLISYALEGMFRDGFSFEALLAPMYMGSIYTIFCVLGLLIGALLKYAFGKEERHED